jgi:hypothetical protein
MASTTLSNVDAEGVDDRIVLNSWGTLLVFLSVFLHFRTQHNNTLPVAGA